MNSTEQMRPHRAPGSPVSGGHASDVVVSLPASEPPTFGEMVEEVLPLIGVVLVVAPPAVFIAGPWLLLGLMLSAPFAVIVALVAAAAALVALGAAIVALLAVPPYLLVRYARARRARRAVAVATPVATAPVATDRVVTAAPAAPRVAIGTPRVAA